MKARYLNATVTALTATSAFAVDYNFGSFTDNFSISASDTARVIGGNTVFNDNGFGGVYDRGSERDTTFGHFNLALLAGATINGNVNLNYTIDANYGGAINNGQLYTVDSPWIYPGSAPGKTAISGSTNSGSYSSGQTASWTIGNSVFQGFLNSPSSFNGFAVSAAGGSTAHFAGPGTLTGNYTAGEIRAVGGTDWSAASYDPGSKTLTIGAADNVSGGNIILSTGTTIAVAGSATLDGGAFSGSILNQGALSLGSSANQVLSGPISGPGSLTKAGTGTLTLAANNSYTGSTSVNGGTLVLQNSYAANSQFSVAQGAVLDLRVASGSRDLPSATFTGDGTLRKTGAGEVVWGGGTATFSLGAGSLIDVQEGVLVGGSYANDNWTGSQADLHVAAGAVFKTVEANARLDGITGSGTLGTGYSGAGYQHLTIGVANGSSTFDGVIQNTDENPAWTGNLVKSGAGTITLNGANTYTGVTTLEGGTLNIGVFSDYGLAGGLGNRGSDGGQNVGILFRGGTLQYTGSTAQSTNRAIRISTNGGATIEASGATPAATLSFTAPSSPDLFEAPGDRALTLTGTNTGDNSFAMAIGEAGGSTSLVKSGSGTWVLSGNSNYTGPTTVNSGSLIIQGNISTSVTTVNNTATLGGSGMVGVVNIKSGGTLSPGNSNGVLSASSLTLETGSLSLFEIGGIARGTQHDGVDVSGALQYGGTLTLDIPALFANGTYVFDLFNAGSESGDFSLINLSGAYSGSLNFDAADLWTLTSGNSTWSFAQSTGDLTLIVIPEPGAMLLGSLGFLGLLRRRRQG